MSSNAATHSRRIASAIAAIAVTALLHGGWLANVGPIRHAPTGVAATA